MIKPFNILFSLLLISVSASSQNADTAMRATFYVGKLNVLVNGIRTATPTKAQLKKAEFLLLNKEMSNTIIGFDMKINVPENLDSTATDVDITINTKSNRKPFIPLHSNNKYITREMNRALRKCKEGSVVVFYHIQTKLASGQILQLNDVKLYIIGEYLSENRRAGNKGGRMDERFL